MMRERSYEEFCKDPMGKDLLEKLEKEKQQRLIDPFVQNIKLMDDIDKHKDVRIMVKEDDELVERMHPDPKNLDDIDKVMKTDFVKELEEKTSFTHHQRANGVFSNLFKQPQKQASQVQNYRQKRQELADICRIPAKMVEKSRTERIQESCETLNQMQNLMKRPKGW